jgi:mRNA-degrading endonuclease toxin of MazEF toxin-antitoxin module
MGSDGIIVYSLYGKGNWDKVKSIRWDLTKDFLGEQRKETIAEILKLINRDF